MSHLEETLAFQLRALNIPHVREFRAVPGRRFRFDFLIDGTDLLIEVEGGTFVAGGGRHNRGAGFRDDCVKASLAAVHGWRLMRVHGDHVESGEAVKWIQQAMEYTVAVPMEPA